MSQNNGWYGNTGKMALCQISVCVAVLQLAYHLMMHIKNAGSGKVFLASVDVELTAKKVFQPDLAVVLNANLVGARFIAPAFGPRLRRPGVASQIGDPWTR